MPSIAPHAGSFRSPASTRRRAAAALGALFALGAPLLPAGTAAATAAPGTVAFGNAPTVVRGYGDLRAATRPGVLALRAAQRPASRAPSGAALRGTTTTYYALASDAAGGALVRFRTDGRAHVSGRTVLSPSNSEQVLAPTSALGGTVVAMQAAPDGLNLVSVDSRGRVRRLTNDGRSSYGLLTPNRHVVFATTNAGGETDGLDEVDAAGGHRRTIFHETDRDAVLSLPALSPNGRTAYLVRNVFDRLGQPQSFLLTIDIRSGRSASRPLPGVNYVVSMAASSNGRDLAFVGYRAADNQYARWIGFRAEADVLPVAGGAPRRVSWVQDPFVVFSRGGSRLIVGTDDRLVSVGVSAPTRDPMYGTEGLSLPVLAR